MKTIIVVFFVLISFNVYSKPIRLSTQQLINRAAVHTDTIFVGRVLEKKEIEGGFILDKGSMPIGILKVEVLTVFRGKIVKNEQRLVCTWFDRREHEFNFTIGREFTFFGIDTGLNIQLPSVNGFIFDSTGMDKEFSKALKLRSKPIKDRNLIFEIVESGDNVTRNACNEPDAWEH